VVAQDPQQRGVRLHVCLVFLVVDLQLIFRHLLSGFGFPAKVQKILKEEERQPGRIF
jgi:hypothetical protein